MVRTTGWTALLTTLILAVFMMFGAAGAIAAEYYMAPNGSDSGGAGSKSSPWKTLKYANTRLSPGDTLYIRGGDYYEEDIDIAVSGTVDKPITIAAYPGETPHFRPGGGSGWDFVRWYTAKNYLTFDGLEISGFSHAAFGIGYGTGITIKNCYIHDVIASKTGAIFTGYYGNTTNVVIENNTLENIGIDTTAHGIYLSRYSANVTIRGNMLLGPIGGYGVHVYSSSSPYPLNIKIYNNVFSIDTGARRVPIIIANGSGHEIYNNTIHVVASGSSLAAHIRINSSASVTAIKNNIFYGSHSAGYIYNNGGTISAIDYNLYWPGSKDSDDGGSNSSQSDPSFKNASALDYHLQSGSSARDTGTTISMVANDKDGIARPQGSKLDRGAYEYVSSVTQTPDISVADSISPSGDLLVPFGDIETGTAVQASITVSNKGTGALSVVGMSISDPVNYSLDASGGAKPCGSLSPSIQMGDLCTVAVVFRPSYAGNFNATLSVNSNDPDSPNVGVSISGSAHNPTPQMPNISVADSIAPSGDLLVPFGDIETGTSSQAVITVSNNGTSALSVVGMSISDPINYSLDASGGAKPCGSLSPNIQAGDLCTVAVVFRPSYAGNFNSTLSVNSNDPDSPNVGVNITGAAHDVVTWTADISVTDSIAPYSDMYLDFGTVKVDTFSSAEVVIANNGNAALTVYAITLSDNVDFALDPNGGGNPCGTLAPVIQPGGSCSIGVAFAPVSDVSYEATIGFSSNDPDSPSISAVAAGAAYFPGNKWNNFNGDSPKGNGKNK